MQAKVGCCSKANLLKAELALKERQLKIALKALEDAAAGEASPERLVASLSDIRALDIVDHPNVPMRR